MNQASADVPRGTSDSTAVVAAVAAPLALPVLLAPGISIVPLIQLQADLEPVETNLEDVEGQVERAKIETQDNYQGGSDILSAIQAQLTLLEDLRTTAKKPADDFGAMVQKLCNPLKLRLTTAKQSLEGKMLAWRNAEEARQKAAADLVRKQQEDEARKLADAARAQGQTKVADKIEEMVAAAPVAPAPRVGHVNYSGKTHAKRTYWLGEAQDGMEILRQIVAGKLPMHIVEFSKSGMNEQAKKYIDSLPEADRKEQVYLGIKITKSDKLV
jgi:hypothetical protein